jgi:hypothetical protein
MDKRQLGARENTPTSAATITNPSSKQTVRQLESERRKEAARNATQREHVASWYCMV